MQTNTILARVGIGITESGGSEIASIVKTSPTGERAFTITFIVKVEEALPLLDRGAGEADQESVRPSGKPKKERS